MKQLFLRRNGSSRLVLFFAGFGQDERPFAVRNKSGCDLGMVYDYEDDVFDLSLYRDYQRVDVVAWSMGVMMAARILEKAALPVTGTVAVNGTLEGIDDELGIGFAMWEATQTALSAVSIGKFYRRMCTPADAGYYLEHCPERDLTGLKKELQYLKSVALSVKPSAFSFDRAYVGLKDRIIPCDNQRRSWSKHGVKTIEGDFAHFPFDKLSQELEL